MRSIATAIFLISIALALPVRFCHGRAERRDRRDLFIEGLRQSRRTPAIDHDSAKLSERTQRDAANSHSISSKKLLLRFTFDGRLAILRIAAAMDRRQ